MSVILKKDEKIGAVLNALPANYSLQDFVVKFKEMYISDWNKLEINYSKHLRDNKPGKPIPMPNPEQYLKNALNVWLNKNK